jgi:guanosine-3',5'-bis(diphosphate) 3'-pyrophosphohydrolase
MQESDWVDLAATTLRETANATRFPEGHATCVAIPQIVIAAGFAAWKHEGHFRKGEGNTPYIHHPVEVMSILAEIGGITDIDVLRAALLHDTVEDTPTTPEELDTHFGIRVREFVLEVTDDKDLEQHERKARQIEHAPHLSHEAKSLKMADKIANIYDVAFNTPSDWPVERQIEYFDWSSKVVAGLRGCNPALEAHFDKQVEISRAEVNS